MVGVGGKTLISRRVSGAVACNLLLHWCLLLSFSLLVKADLSEGLTAWIRNTVGMHLTWRYWLWAIPLVLVTGAQGIVSCRPFVVPSKCPRSRVESVVRVLDVHNLTVLILDAFVGLCLPLIYTSLEGNEYSDFLVECGGNGICLSEDRVRMVCGGLFTALYYFLDNHLSSDVYPDSPLLQQKKSVSIKSSVYPTAKSSVRYSLTPLVLYLVVYHFYGGWLIDVVSGVTGYTAWPGEATAIRSVKRWCHLWTFAVIIVFTLKTMENIVKVFLTERHEFPLTDSVSTEYTMERALAEEDVPIIKHLAFRDLALLCEKGTERRKDIYTLSRPGGHPHTWRGIKTQCLRVIHQFTASLEGTTVKRSETSAVSPPPVSRRYESTRYYTSAGGTAASPLLCTSLFASSGRALLDCIADRAVALANSRPVRYLFGDVPSLKIRHLILNGCPVADAAQSLSFVCVHSLTEDTYGVLQTDVSEIITTLMHLERALDSLHKNPSRIARARTPPLTKMLATLTNKVRRSLYHVAIHFRPFIADLGLAKADEMRLQAYSLFKQ